MTEIDVDEAAKELAALQGSYEEAARALAAAQERIRARHWPAEEEQFSSHCAQRHSSSELSPEARKTPASPQERGAS